MQTLTVSQVRHDPIAAIQAAAQGQVSAVTRRGLAVSVEYHRDWTHTNIKTTPPTREQTIEAIRLIRESGERTRLRNLGQPSMCEEFLRTRHDI